MNACFPIHHLHRLKIAAWNTIIGTTVHSQQLHMHKPYVSVFYCAYYVLCVYIINNCPPAPINTSTWDGETGILLLVALISVIHIQCRYCLYKGCTAHLIPPFAERPGHLLFLRELSLLLHILPGLLTQHDQYLLTTGNTSTTLEPHSQVDDVGL